MGGHGPAQRARDYYNLLFVHAVLGNAALADFIRETPSQPVWLLWDRPRTEALYVTVDDDMHGDQLRHERAL
jgi:hypothetical protein